MIIWEVRGFFELASLLRRCSLTLYIPGTKRDWRAIAVSAMPVVVADLAAPRRPGSPRRPDVDRITSACSLPSNSSYNAGQISARDRLTYCRPARLRWIERLASAAELMRFRHPVNRCDYFAPSYHFRPWTVVQCLTVGSAASATKSATLEIWSLGCCYVGGVSAPIWPVSCIHNHCVVRHDVHCTKLQLSQWCATFHRTFYLYCLFYEWFVNKFSKPKWTNIPVLSFLVEMMRIFNK